MSSPLSSLLFLTLLVGAVAVEPEFPLTADSMPQAGVSKGTMIKGSHKAAQDSVFPGTEREYQIYIPHGHDESKPAAFMVFQDGVIYQAPVVFDNLIAKKDIPPLVGIFIRPGVVPAAGENALPRFNRSHEYDSITPTYSGFLIDEFLPAIEARHGLRLTQDPNQSAIAGNSSGGICAFMTAWHRPDRFRRVFTGVGTYVGIHGADRLPVLVRKMEPKPLRIFLQSGTGDNNLYCGDWWMANQMIERSLAWAGYDVNHAWGEGGHNQKHASQIFPEVMRWLWRDWRTTMEVRANPQGTSKWRGYEVLGLGAWQKSTLGPASRLQVNAEGVVSASPEPNARSVNQAGVRFDRPASLPEGTVTTLSPDQTQLYATQPQTNYLIIARTSPDGGISLPQPYVQLEPAPSDSSRELAEASGLCVDVNGWLYAATSLGIQICDQAGRVNFILPTPERPLDVCFGGPGLSELHVACGKTTYRRQTTTKGVVTDHQPAVKPPPPKL
jgi:enterochelin esterase-like enzyme